MLDLTTINLARKQKRSNSREKETKPRRQRSIARWIVVGVALFICAAGLLLWRPWAPPKGQSDPKGDALLRPEAAVFAEYAGSSSCKDCHRQAYDHWSQSHHGLAERPLEASLDKVAFDPPREFHHGTQTSNVLLKGSEYQISSKDLSGKNQPHIVTRVIGVDPLRQFLVPAPGGRLQAMEATYDPHQNQWFDVYGDEDRQPGEWGHWTGRAMTWNSMCAACHNTRLRKDYDAPSDSYHTAMAQGSASCEACHGPMKQHVTWEQKYAGKKDPNLKRLSRDQMLDTCGSCHSRRGELTGDFAPGDSFFDHYMLNTVDGSDVFYPDGQVHEEDYEFSAFLGSKMQAAGVRCVDCHDPHSGKTILEGNALCMRCHAGNYPKAPVINPALHTFHQPDSAGSQCINCHMPQTTYMQRHRRHDHGFTIPDPLLTKQLNIPNACNRCHTDKDADWALAAADKWYGAKLDRPTRHRAQTIASGRANDPSAKPGLLAIMNDASQPPYWRAVVAGLLSSSLNDQSIQSSLMQKLSADHPLIRMTAARTLAPLAHQTPNVAQAMQRLLSDSSRSVRLAAASALQDQLDPNSLAGREFAIFLDQQSDQPAGQLQQAMYCIARQDAANAAAHLSKAIEWEQHSATMRREVAVAYGMIGQSSEAAAQLEKACELDPRNADYPYLLGLSYAEMGRPQQSMAALERAVQLDPHHSRAWYNLGLARRDAGQSDAALAALQQSEAADPTDPDVPYARATMLLQLGRMDEARQAAQRALRIRSDYAPAQQLLQNLGQ